LIFSFCKFIFVYLSAEFLIRDVLENIKQNKVLYYKFFIKRTVFLRQFFLYLSHINKTSRLHNIRTVKAADKTFNYFNFTGPMLIVLNKTRNLNYFVAEFSAVVVSSPAEVEGAVSVISAASSSTAASLGAFGLVPQAAKPSPNTATNAANNTNFFIFTSPFI
jgi:hypothetical protein